MKIATALLPIIILSKNQSLISGRPEFIILQYHDLMLHSPTIKYSVIGIGDIKCGRSYDDIE